MPVGWSTWRGRSHLDDGRHWNHTQLPLRGIREGSLEPEVEHCGKPVSRREARGIKITMGTATFIPTIYFGNTKSSKFFFMWLRRKQSTLLPTSTRQDSFSHWVSHFGLPQLLDVHPGHEEPFLSTHKHGQHNQCTRSSSTARGSTE